MYNLLLNAEEKKGYSNQDNINQKWKMIKRKNFKNDNKTNIINNNYNKIKIIKQNEKNIIQKIMK